MSLRDTTWFPTGNRFKQLRRKNKRPLSMHYTHDCGRQEETLSGLWGWKVLQNALWNYWSCYRLIIWIGLNWLNSQCPHFHLSHFIRVVGVCNWPCSKWCRDIHQLALSQDEMMSALIVLSGSRLFQRGFAILLSRVAKSISPLLETELALWLALANRKQWKQRCVSSESPSQEALHTVALGMPYLPREQAWFHLLAHKVM